MNLVRLEWDSKFYGFPVAKVDIYDESDFNLTSLYSQLDLSDFKLVYLFDHTLNLKIESNKSDCLIDLVDRKVVYRKSIRDTDFNEDNNEIKIETCLSNDLIQLALESGLHSRFKLDNRFPKNKFEEMYQIWIEKSLTGEMANVVYGSYSNEKLNGFVTLKISNNIGTIGLIAVKENMRGNGIGKKLMKAAECYALKNNVNEIHVATQLDNINACMFYEINDYSIYTIENIYHIWRNDDNI